MFQTELFPSLINIGHFGQYIARTYLQKQGYTILSENTRIKHDEIDIIAEHNKVLSFVEVKTRLNSYCERAEYHFSKNKISNLKRAAAHYAHANSLSEDIRLEGIAIQLDYLKKMANIKHFISLI